MNKKYVVPYILMCVSVIFSFGFITLLKFQNPTTNLFGFIGCLVGMHVGIFAIIFAKKSFAKVGKSANKFVKEIELYWVFYIPLLLFKFVVNNIWKETKLPEDVFMAIILTMTAIFVVLSVRQLVGLAKQINADTLPDYVPKVKKAK